MQELTPTRCFLCSGERGDTQMYGQRLSATSLSGYSFSARRARRIEHYRIVRCNGCGLVRSSPVAGESTINSLYEESSFIYSSEAPYAASTYADLYLHAVKASGIRPESVLEIGCGTGFFLEAAMSMGVGDVAGFEPSRDCVDRAAPAVRGKIINSYYDPSKLDGRVFGAMASFHVFDHLPDPLGVLTSAKASLKPGGLLLLVTHDVESWSAKLLGEYNPIFDVEHIYLFSRDTMGGLLKKAGFEIVEIGSLKNTYPLEYWMRMTPIAGALLPLTPGPLKRIPIGFKAGNLYAVAKKEG